MALNTTELSDALVMTTVALLALSATIISLLVCACEKLNKEIKKSVKNAFKRNIYKNKKAVL